jgi:hypothetical protein
MWGSLIDKEYETYCHTLGELRNYIRSENSTVPPETLQRVNSNVSCRYAEYIRRKDAKPPETQHKKQIRRGVELALIDQVGNSTLVVVAVVVLVMVVIVAVTSLAVVVTVVVAAVVVVIIVVVAVIVVVVAVVVVLVMVVIVAVTAVVAVVVVAVVVVVIVVVQ